MSEIRIEENMGFPIYVDVSCAEGKFGKSTTVIVDPATEKVSFIAVSHPEAEVY